MKFETLQVHAGHDVDDTMSCVPGLWQTTAYHFKSAEHAANLFALKEFGNIYTRLQNPTTDIFEKRVAALLNAPAAVATASGHAAQLVTLTSLACSGDNFVSSPYLYGGSYNQFSNSLRNMGIQCRFAAGIEPADFEKLIDDNTKALYVETISNANLSIPDFEKLAAVAHAHSIPLVVDNTFGAAGYFCNPFEYGADIIVESATKWIGGHSTSMGGIIVDGGTFDWGASGKFPLIAGPSESYHGMNFWETFGNIAFAIRCRVEGQRDLGAPIAPFNSFMMLQGLETLSLRTERQAYNAMELAKWLEKQPKVESVNYPGLPNSPYHEAAKKYLRNGFGGVLMVTFRGTLKGTADFTENLKLISNISNLGDVRTLATHMASTTHSQLSADELREAGIAETMLRISLGVEHIDDIKADMEQAFAYL